jgi:hypothetical protein
MSPRLSSKAGPVGFTCGVEGPAASGKLGQYCASYRSVLPGEIVAFDPVSSDDAAPQRGHEVLRPDPDYPWLS